MRKLVLVLVAFALLSALASTAEAHRRHRHRRHVYYGAPYTYYAPYTYSPYYYGGYASPYVYDDYSYYPRYRTYYYGAPVATTRAGRGRTEYYYEGRWRKYTPWARHKRRRNVLLGIGGLGLITGSGVLKGVGFGGALANEIFDRRNRDW